MFIMNDSGCGVENRLCQSKRQSKRSIRRLFQNPGVRNGALDKGVGPGCGERGPDLGCNLKVEPCC